MGENHEEEEEEEEWKEEKEEEEEEGKKKGQEGDRVKSGCFNGGCYSSGKKNQQEMGASKWVW